MNPFIDEIFYRISRRKSINKRLRITATLMMLTVFFNTFANKNLYSQTEISLDLNNTSIIRVLDHIESTTDLRFIFDSDIFNFKEKVTLSIEKKSLNYTLNTLFGAKVIYELKENLVFLKEIVEEVETPILLEEEEEEAQAPITGIIVDGDGVPLPGVNVFIKGTNTGTATDFDGNYSIPAAEGDVLVFSYVGFENQELIVGNEQNIDISMEADYANLDEVVITGYGSTAKKDLVSSISQIKGDALVNQPVARVDNMLQGRAAGVNVVSTSGEPGAAATIRIRGMSSINGNNQPLFVIDGFIVGTDFNLSNLNVNDIESIEVLKDASSLAIYGTRGAAGVILINTKSGLSTQEGKVDVSINHYTSMQQVYNYPEMASIGVWAEYWNEGVTYIDTNYGTNDPSLAGNAIHAPNWESITPTDWRGLITRNGRIDNTDVNISGNTGNANYFISYNRFVQEGIIKASGLERNSLRANFDLKVNDKIRTGIRMAVTDRKQENNKVNYQNVYYTLLPTMSVFKPDGSYNGENPVSGEITRNPVHDINERIDHNFVTNVLANAFVEFDIASDFTLRSSVGTNLIFNKGNRYVGNLDPQTINSGTGGDADVTFGKTTGFLNENTITYSKDFGEHSLKVLAGYTMQKDVFSNVEAGGAGYANDAVTFNSLSLGADAGRNVVGSSYRQRTFESILGRINYSFRDKYLLTLVGRRDGSSVFEEGKKYAFFPSAGAAWKISEEDFMQDIEAISSLKLRASYGIVGEQGVDPYNSLARYNPSSIFFNQSISPAVTLASLPSTGLEWEKTYQTDIGVEIGFLNNRYSVEIDYYNKQTKDLLLAKPLPGTAGDTRLENVGQVENKGFEFTFNSVNIEKPDFVWSSNFQISANRNKVVSIGEVPFIDLRNPNHAQAGTGAVRLIAGEVMPTFMGAVYEGTYKSAAEIDADQRTGIDGIGSPNYVDQNGDGAINVNDFVVLGSPQPDFYYGLRNTFTYKNWTMDVFIQGMQGNEIFDASIYEHYYGRGPETNMLPIVADRWTTSNPNSDIPRAGSSAGSYRPNSSLNVVDGSYIRLKNITLNYDIPNLPFVDTASVYLTGNNLLLITDYKWGDPEVSDGGSGTVAQGVADDQYPYASSVALGFRLTL